MREATSFFLVSVFLIILSSSTLWAAPVQWVGNNHWYEPVHEGSGINWADADTAAQNAGGYLATITSEAENDFVFALINNPIYWYIDGADNNDGPWLGGYYDGPLGQMDATNWKWVNGDLWIYSNWDNGEPNFTNERRLNYFSNEASASNPIRQPFWNNVPEESLNLGYIIEYDAYPVPLPAGFWFLGSGLIGLAGFRRKFKK